MHKTSDYEYDLPAELIAQEPLAERTAARMMVVDRAKGEFAHMHVGDLPGLLRKDDLLVVNDTKVIPARVFGTKTDSGGKAEVLFLEELPGGLWSAMLHTRGKLRNGLSLSLGHGRIRAMVENVAPDGRVELSVVSDRPLEEVLEEEGSPPLPPYIKRPSGTTPDDKLRYQTVYARSPGAVAAPTAGMHLTSDLLEKLDGSGIAKTAVTLHVGIGTFRPVKVEDLDAHRMESERYEITETAAAAIRKTRTAGGRVVAVGTTTVRVLETAADNGGEVRPASGRTELFIRPPYAFRAVDALLTNFHLPKSTLLMMVSAFAGRDLILSAYAEAVRLEYRFYSYGDCMLIV